MVSGHCVGCWKKQVHDSAVPHVGTAYGQPLTFINSVALFILKDRKRSASERAVVNAVVKVLQARARTRAHTHHAKI